MPEIRPFQTPSWALAQQRAVGLQTAQTQGALAQKQLADYDVNREQQQKNRETSLYFKGLGAIGNYPGNKEAQQKIWQTLGINQPMPEVAGTQDDVTYSFQMDDGTPVTVTGNPQKIRPIFQHFEKDPDWTKDPKNVAILQRDLMANGIGFEVGAPLDGSKTKLQKDKATTIDEKGVKWVQDRTFNPTTGKYKLVGEKRKVETAKGDKAAKKYPYRLPSGKVVSSDGKTYVEDGVEQLLPANALRVSVSMTNEEIRLSNAQEQAEEENDADINAPPTTKRTPEAAALLGTGPWSQAKAAADAVFGGFFGIDRLFGSDGFFKDTQDSRQYLKLIKQVGKTAIMNSSRGATYEQKIIDNLFANPNKSMVNPRAEARKFEKLRQFVRRMKWHNNEMIKTSKNIKLVEKLQLNNAELGELLTLLPEDVSAFQIAPEDEALIQRRLNKANE